MAERSPEQILQEEVRRLTRTQTVPASATLPAIHSATSATQRLPAVTASRAASTTRSSAPSTTSSRQVNQSYTLPVPQPAQAQSTSSSTLGTIGSTAMKVFTSGLGLMPLISGLAGLFGGGSHQAPPPLIPYAMPQSIHVNAANSPAPGGSYQQADQSQSGQPRAYGQPQSQSTTGAAQSSAASSPQVVVNVSAMDSQSFMDRSQDIAQAVRQAMLNMHSINDVVSEL